LNLDKSNAATIGMIVGALGGLYVGYTRNYSILLSVFIGGVAGNLLTRVLIKPKRKEDEE
jgi:LytS/YehU family sensor histidine kinase